jgi:hypothetical protein
MTKGVFVSMNELFRVLPLAQEAHLWPFNASPTANPTNRIKNHSLTSAA